MFIYTFSLCFVLAQCYILENAIDGKSDTKFAQFFANFLAKFHGFQVIFHVDANTIEMVNDVIETLTGTKNKTSPTSLLLYNHDSFKESSKFYRPRVQHVVIILFLNNTLQWPKLANALFVNQMDVVMFIGKKENVKDLVLVHGLPFLKLAGKILIVEDLEQGFGIYETCYYCGDDSKQFKLLETTENVQSNIKPNDLMPNNFRDLNGHLLHAVFVQYYPFVFCKNKSIIEVTIDGVPKQVCTKVKGIESELLHTMSRKLNFTYYVHILDSNATFFDMIQHIHKRKADVAFGGISITADRIPLVQFTKQYNAEDYFFMYVYVLSFKEIFDKFMEPFNAALVWALYIASFFALSVLLYAALRANRDKENGGKTFAESLWTLLHILIEQSEPDIGAAFRSRLSCALVLALCWWASVIVNTLYKSSILAAMVNPPNSEPEDIEQLVLAGYGFAGNIQYADIIKDLLHVSDQPLYREALRKTVYGDDACDVFKMIVPGHVAMLDESSEIQFEIRTLCETWWTKQTQELLRIARKPVRSTGHGWALQIGAPFRAAFDYYLSLVLSGGFYKKWTQDMTAKIAGDLIPRSNENNSKSEEALSLDKFLPLLTIYAAGILLSIMCYFVELFIHVVSNG